MSQLKELQQAFQAKVTSLKPLAQKGQERTEQENDLYDQGIREANALWEQVEQEKAAADLQARSAQLDEPVAQRVSGIVPGETPLQATRHQTTNIGHEFVASEAYQDYLADPKGRSMRFDIGSWDKPFASDGPEEGRALVYTGATANLIVPQRLPGVYGPSLMPFQVRMRDVLINGTTDSNSIQYVREGTYTNLAAETAEAVSTVTGAKPESTLTFSVVSDNVATIAHWIPITRQILDDAAQMQTYINGRLIDGLKLREDAEVLAGDGTGANIQGLMNRSGIGNLDGAYWTANPLPTAGAAANKIDRIRRAKKYAAVTGLSMPTFVVLNPDDLEQFDELKTTTGEYVIGDPVGYNPIPRLWGLTVVESTSIAANNFLVGDGRMAGIFDRMEAQVFIADQHSDFFVRNIFVLLAEERLALAVFRPSAFVKGILS